MNPSNPNNQYNDQTQQWPQHYQQQPPPPYYGQQPQYPPQQQPGFIYSQGQPPPQKKPSLFNVKERQAYYKARMDAWPKWKQFGLGCGSIIMALLVCGLCAIASTPPAKPAVQPAVTHQSTATQAVATPTHTAPTATPTHAAAPTPTPVPPAPTPIPVKPTPIPPAPTQPSAPPAQPPAPPAVTGVNGNPWGYDFTPGKLITDPPLDFCTYFDCIPSFWKSTNGYVDECNDGTYSHSGGVRGACSSGHGGEMRPLYSH